MERRVRRSESLIHMTIDPVLLLTHLHYPSRSALPHPQYPLQSQLPGLSVELLMYRVHGDNMTGFRIRILVIHSKSRLQPRIRELRLRSERSRHLHTSRERVWRVAARGWSAANARLLAGSKTLSSSRIEEMSRKKRLWRSQHQQSKICMQ